MGLFVLISCGLRAAIVLSLGLSAHALLGRAAASTRRLVLAVTLGAALVVPAVSAVSPRWEVPAPQALSTFARDVDAAPSSSASSPGAPTPPAARRSEASARMSVGPKDLAGIAWLAVVIGLLLRTLRSHLLALALVRRSRPLESDAWRLTTDEAGGRGIQLRVSDELDSPAVFGLLRSTVVVPERALEWPIERCRVVVLHELAHARRRDVLVQALADVACALHWCNPLVWLCARRLRVERELAADDCVLESCVLPSRYAEELLAVTASIAAPSAALAMAERSSLEGRIAAVLALGRSRAPLAPRAVVAIVATGAVIAAATACAAPAASAHVDSAATAPRPGSATDPKILAAAQDELAALQKQWSPELATIVVLDPATGEILANAGLRGGVPADIASTTAVVPGSTLKPITLAAALETRAIAADQTFECGPAPRMYGKQEIHDSAPHGTLDLGHMLAVSSNIGTSHVFDSLGGERLISWLHRFHLDEAPSVAGAASGAFPARVANGSYEGAEVAIGEASTATPLQMIGAYGALVSDGVYHSPTLDRGGSRAERLVSSETAAVVTRLLETAVVDDTATGKAARVDGVHVAGKTGTAQWTAADGRDRTYASFIGVADLPARRLVMLIGLQSQSEDLTGGSAAAPAFSHLVQRLR